MSKDVVKRFKWQTRANDAAASSRMSISTKTQKEKLTIVGNSVSLWRQLCKMLQERIQMKTQHFAVSETVLTLSRLHFDIQQIVVAGARTTWYQRFCWSKVCFSTKKRSNKAIAQTGSRSDHWLAGSNAKHVNTVANGSEKSNFHQCNKGKQRGRCNLLKQTVCILTQVVHAIACRTNFSIVLFFLITSRSLCLVLRGLQTARTVGIWDARHILCCLPKRISEN